MDSDTAASIAEWVVEHPDQQVAVVAPSMVRGEQIMQLVYDALRDADVEYTCTFGRRLDLTPGGRVQVFTGQNIDMMRGCQFHRAWAIDPGSWAQPPTDDEGEPTGPTGLDVLEFATRLGESPIVTQVS